MIDNTFLGKTIVTKGESAHLKKKYRNRKATITAIESDVTVIVVFEGETEKCAVFLSQIDTLDGKKFSTELDAETNSVNPASYVGGINNAK